MAREAARNIHQTCQYTGTDKERKGSEGSDGDLSPRKGLQRLFPLWLWAQPLVGQAERHTHPSREHGLQTFDC